MERQRLASLISGGGTTMEQIGLACKRGEIPADLVCVIASTSDAKGIQKALKLGIPQENVLVVDPNKYKKDGKVNQDDFAEGILKELRARGITVITQNGWLPLTPRPVIEEYKGRIFNQHPGPLPETKGLKGKQPHSAVLYIARRTEGITQTYVIAQRVTEKFDEGAIVAMKEIPIRLADHPARLQSRALPFEHLLQIEMLRDFAARTLRDLPPASPFLSSGNEKLLSEARAHARKKFPNG